MSNKSREQDKPKKVKLVRDSFCMPKDEYTAIDALKARGLGLSLAVKKSELLRAGLMALSALDDAALKGLLLSVPTLKTGRPPMTESVASNTPEAAQPATPAPKKAAAPRRAKAAAAEPTGEPPKTADKAPEPTPATPTTTPSAPRKRRSATTAAAAA